MGIEPADIFFSTALVGNRVLPLRITTNGGEALVVSDGNPSILFAFPQFNEFHSFLSALAQRLNVCSAGMIGVRIGGSEDSPELVAGLELPLAIPLRQPTNPIWHLHLNRFMQKEHTIRAELQQQNDQLLKTIQDIQRENEMLKQRSEFQQKEIDLLRMVVDSKTCRIKTPTPCAASSRTISAQNNISPVARSSPSNEENSTIKNEKRASSPSPSTSEIPTSSLIFPVCSSLPKLKIEQISPEIQESDDIDVVDVELGLGSESAQTPPPGPSVEQEIQHSKSRKSEDVLWGVAQYILCQLCPEQAADVEGMENHFLSAHIDKEKQNCAACPSEKLSDLMQHMLQHTNRVYACGFCGKRGKKHFLKAHVRTHTGEKPFACETCGRCFSDGSTLRRHRLVHSGEKKHTCPICGRRIARKDNVKVHIRSHGVHI